MDVQASVLVHRATHIHHIGVAGVIRGVCTEVHQHHPAHSQEDAPLVVGGRVSQGHPNVPSIEQERQAQQCPWKQRDKVTRENGAILYLCGSLPC